MTTSLRCCATTHHVPANRLTVDNSHVHAACPSCGERRSWARSGPARMAWVAAGAAFEVAA